MGKLRFVALGIGILCLWLMAEGNANITGLIDLMPMHIHVQFGLFCVGVGLVYVGITGLSSRWGLKNIVNKQISTPIPSPSPVDGGRERIQGRGVPPLPACGVGGRGWGLEAAHASQHWIIFIILLGFFLRIINLENSIHIFVDEMHFIEGITGLWDNPHTPLLSPMGDIAAFTWFHAYLQTFMVDIFGAGFTAPRMIGAFFGTLTIPAVYVLVNTWFDRKTALIAALLLAVFPPHVHFSRLALNNIADPFFGTLALAFFARGIARAQYIAPLQNSHSVPRGDGRGMIYHAPTFSPNARLFALSGVMLGLTQYWYEGGKLVFPGVMLLWIIWLALTRPRRTSWRGIGVMMLCAFIVAAPLLLVLHAGHHPYTPRLDTRPLGDKITEALLAPDGMQQFQSYLNHHLLPAATHLVWTTDGAQYYGGSWGFILPYLLPFFFIGVGVLLWRRQMMPLVWIGLVVLGNSLLLYSNWSARFVAVLPALVIVLAVGVQRTLGVIEKDLPHPLAPSPLRSEAEPDSQAWESPLSRYWRGDLWVRYSYAPIYLQILVLLLIFSQIPYYFGPHLAEFNVQVRPFKDHQDVGWRARDLPPDTHIYLFTDELVYYRHISSMMRYWGIERDVHFLHPLHLMLRGNYRLPHDAGLAIFVQPENRELLRFLSGTFTLPAPQFSPYNVPRERQYALYYLPFEGENDD